MTGITDTDKRKIIGVIKAVIPETKIYLYGSRARGDFHSHSDIDIALEAKNKIDRFSIGEIKEMLENSSIAYHFDITDISTVPENMKRIILSEGILWSD